MCRLKQRSQHEYDWANSGVHAGAALAGNFGGNRFYCTAYVDTINTPHGSGQPTSNWLRAFALALTSPAALVTPRADRSVISCSLGEASLCLPISRCPLTSKKDCQRKATPKR